MSERFDPLSRPHGAYREEVERELKVRCIHLKTKEAFLGLPAEHESGFDGDEPIWWCEKTLEALGPDGSAACRADCHGLGRACYEAPKGPMA